MRSRKGMVGLSIGSRNMTLVEINASAGKLTEIRHIGITEISDQAIHKGNVSDANSALRSLRDTLAASGVDDARYVSLSVEDDIANTRLMVMPSLSRNEILQSLTSEVEDYAILVGSNPVLDFQVAERISEGGTERMHVFFSVAPDDIIDSYVSLADSANLKLEHIEIIPLSVFRTFVNVFQTESLADKSVMLVVIEDNRGMLIISQNNVIKFIHDIEIGSAELQEHLDIDELEREIMQSLDYFQNQFPSEKAVEEIFLFADGLDDTDVHVRLKDKLNLPVNMPQFPDELLGEFKDSSRNNMLSICSAIGSALHRVSGKGELNLLPGRKDEKKSGSGSGLRVAALIIIFVFILSSLVVASFTIRSMKDSVEEDLIVLQQQSLEEVPDVAELEAINASIAQLEARIEVTDVAVNSIKWANCARLLEEIRILAPRTVWLTGLTWNEDKSATIVGYALSYESFFEFRRQLINSSYFDPIKFDNVHNVEMAGQVIRQFSITCGVKRETMGGGI